MGNSDIHLAGLSGLPEVAQLTETRRTSGLWIPTGPFPFDLCLIFIFRFAFLFFLQSLSRPPRYPTLVPHKLKSHLILVFPPRPAYEFGHVFGKQPIRARHDHATKTWGIGHSWFLIVLNNQISGVAGLSSLYRMAEEGAPAIQAEKRRRGKFYLRCTSL